MRNTRPQCYEIPSVHVAMAIKRAIERKGPAAPRRNAIPTTPEIPVVNGADVRDISEVVAPAPRKPLLSAMKLVDRPRKIA
jgi:hypothetical protein